MNKKEPLSSDQEVNQYLQSLLGESKVEAGSLEGMAILQFREVHSRLQQLAQQANQLAQQLNQIKAQHELVLLQYKQAEGEVQGLAQLLANFERDRLSGGKDGGAKTKKPRA